MASRAATFLSAAEHIGHRVCDDALWRGDTCTWEGPLPTVVDGRWSSTIRPFGAELYSGTSGVALFLARLHRATGERRFGDTAAAAARDAVMRLGELPPPLRSGLYTGFGGIALASLAVGDALDDEDFTHTGLRLLGTIRRLDPAAQSRDLLSGTAGAIALLLASYRKRGLDEDLDAAARFGAFLAGAANRDGDAWSWSTYGTVAAPGERDLAGLAHGAAGIAFALLELHEATGEPAFLEAAEAGYSYEQRWFSAERGNWADVRAVAPDGDAGDAAYLVQWCYGAAGLGLAHMRAYELLGDAGRHAASADAGLRTVASDLVAFPHNAQPNYSLCHGLCGNAELLLMAAEVLGEPELRVTVEEMALAAIEQHMRGTESWPTGAAEAQETASLMWGLAGIGHFFLRLADPAGTPSVVLPVAL